VNDILANAGYTPVQSLAAGGPLQAVLAEQELDRQMRRVLLKNWWFNREVRDLTADSAGIVALPADILKVEEGPLASLQYFERAGQLWSRSLTGTTTNVFTASGDVTVRVTVFLEWDDVPNSAQEYAVALARLEFQATRVGDRATIARNTDQRDEALAVLAQDEGEFTDANMLLNPSLRYNLRPAPGFNRYDP